MPIAAQNSDQRAGTSSSANLLGVRVVSTGMYVPENVVTNEDLARLGCDSEWIIQRTGIQSRRHVLPGQATSDLALQAAQNCLNNGGTAVDEIDLILVATMTPDHYTPSVSCLVQARLGATCGAMDLNAACSGFLYALITGAQFVKTGCFKKVLVIGAETMTMVIDPNDKRTYPLFGDGAGAVLLESDPEPDLDQASGILAFRLASVGQLSDSLVVPAGGSRKPCSEEVARNREQFLRMDGRTVFKWAVRLIPEIVGETLGRVNFTLADVDLLILHQANERILKAATEDLQIDPDRVFVNLASYGNTSSASVPISLYEACAAGRIKRGDHVMLAGFGAGLTWASCLFRW